MSFALIRSTALACLCILAMAVGAPAASASDNPELDKAIYDLSIAWENAKFNVPPGEEQNKEMDALGEKADALLQKYPDRVEAMIWDGILTSERASLTSAFAALRLAKRARNTLEKAYELDPAALDAGAPTSLGVLYYRVPGWPIGFGDTDKARQLLEQATKLAPEGLDAWYFYGDFLYSESEYAGAVTAFQHALAIPAHPDRPLWDKARRLVIQELLAKIQQKS
jgi:tetratricopeptide (TPR) repeat protein